MTDLSRWPTKPDSRRRYTQGVTIPAEWRSQFNEDLYTIRLKAGAENFSHAIILAVHEMAERLRKEEGH